MSQTREPSQLDTCGATTEGLGIPLFEECSGVGVQETVKSPNGICGAVCAMVVMPTGHFTLIFVALHVRGGAKDGLVDVTVGEAILPV